MALPLQVLVVGAGPTGLTLASELARRGVSARIIDRAAEPTQLSKAIGVQARTLEIFDDMGIADQAVSAGLKLVGVAMFANGEPIVKASFDELDTHYPFLLSIPQSDTERILAELLVRRGGSVERGVELVDIAQHEDRVTATLRHANGRSEAVDARWLVGADGAHSTVRRLAGLGFEGSSYDDRFVLADVRIGWDFPRDRVTTFFSETGLLACFPLPGERWRLIATVEDSSDDAPPPTLEEFQAIVDLRCHVQSTLSDPAWLARFRIHCRQVKRYRAGNVFVAGDAAHIHSPVGGQGLNTGIQDGHNLAWKLDLVSRGKAPPALLDSYHLERHAVGVALLRGTDFATRVATLKHPVVRAVRNRMSSFLSSLEVVQQRITKSVAELTLSYADSPIVGEHRSSMFRSRIGEDESDERPNVSAWWAFDSAAGPGARAPDGLIMREGAEEAVRLATVIDGRRHTLLLFDGRAPTEEGYARLAAVAHAVEAKYRDLVDVHVVVPGDERPTQLAWKGSVLMDIYGDLEDRYGARAECLYLIRPDLYVGFRSQPADQDALLAYLQRIFI
jgi:2-polyprenyl-6-methoxyphenol hydroxylase-like FAD-dependent oxidoreductase